MTPASLLNPTQRAEAWLAGVVPEDGEFDIFQADDDVASIIRDLLAERAWMPIADAPRDGELVLLGNADDPSWPLRCRRWETSLGDHWRGQDADEATHFLPLPEPPKP